MGIGDDLKLPEGWEISARFECGCYRDIERPKCGYEYVTIRRKKDPTISWEIRHPGDTQRIMTCKTFEDAMDAWFEGFNLPYKVTNGKRESFDSARSRVDMYYEQRRATNGTK